MGGVSTLASHAKEKAIKKSNNEHRLLEWPEHDYVLSFCYLNAHAYKDMLICKERYSVTIAFIAPFVLFVSYSFNFSFKVAFSLPIFITWNYVLKRN